MVGTVCVGAFLGQLDASIAGLVRPTLEEVFGAPVASVEWVAIAYLFTLAALVVPIGRMADLLGRKTLYTCGFLVFIAGSAACGFAPGLAWLVAFRVVQANSVAIITAAVPRRTLGRAIGIQGPAQDLARLVAARLGYRYVSRDEVSALANSRSGLDHTPRTPETEGRALSLLEQLEDHVSGERSASRSALEAAVMDLAMADNVVIVGHGAGLFLPDLRSVLRVLVVAPLADRVARVIAEDQLEPERARSVVEEQDRESAAYLRSLFGVDWMDPHNWDIVINLGCASISGAVEMLTACAERRTVPSGSRTACYVANSPAGSGRLCPRSRTSGWTSCV